MQCQDIMLDRHLVKEDGENTLLHFSRVLGPQDDHLLVSEIDGYGSR